MIPRFLATRSARRVSQLAVGAIAVALTLAATRPFVGRPAGAEGQAGSSLPQPSVPGAALFVDGAVHGLALELTSRDILSLRQRPREYVRATVRAGQRVYPAVAARLKGSRGSFRNVDDKPSLTLDFSRFNPGQRFHGLRRIYLNNSVEDPSALNEWLGAEVFRAAGIPAPRVAHARVRLNGRGLGLYVLKEGFTEDFLAAHFARTDGSLYDDDEGHDVDQRMHRTLGTRPDGAEEAIETLAKAAREPDLKRRWQRLEPALDVDRFVRFMAVEVLLGHRDGYSLARNNFRLYHDPDNGRLVFLPDGMDQLLGLADYPWQPRMAGLVAAATLETPEGRARYADCFARLRTSVFGTAALTNRVNELLVKLRPNLSRQESAALASGAAQVKERIGRRAISLEQQLRQPAPTPMEFREGVARPSPWFKVDEPAGGRMDREPSPDGVSALHIAAGPNTSASWRAAVRLGRGHYRFEGRVKVLGVAPRPAARRPGAGLRVGGQMRRGEGLVGASAWTPMVAEFEVTSEIEEVQLLCELEASAGESWADLNSLRVVAADPAGESGKTAGNANAWHPGAAGARNLSP